MERKDQGNRGETLALLKVLGEKMPCVLPGQTGITEKFSLQAEGGCLTSFEGV